MCVCVCVCVLCVCVCVCLCMIGTDAQEPPACVQVCMCVYVYMYVIHRSNRGGKIYYLLCIKKLRTHTEHAILILAILVLWGGEKAEVGGSM